jgi:hypothetical protein
MREIAIRNVHPTVVAVDGEIVARDIGDNIVVLDEPAIAIETARLQAEWDAQQYARDRKAEYDALNQFELISDDANNGTTTHIDAVNAIKTKYPK